MPLCTICTTLDLGPDEIDETIPQTRFRSKKEDKEVRLGPYSSLVEKQCSCENCNFFLEILHTSNQYTDRTEDLEGKIIYLSSKRLDVREVGEEDCSTFTCDDLLFDICVSEDYIGKKDPEIDVRRIIPENPSDEICMKQIQTWMEECSSTHPSCGDSGDVILPERIIEVPTDTTLPPKLLNSSNQKGKYIILSQCIDSPKNPRFTPSELETFKTGIDTTTLPTAFAEAITISRSLGFRYLWISSLCNTNDKYIPTNLANIYLNSTLLLSPSTSPNPTTSFLNARNLKALYSPALGAHKNRFYRLRCLRWKDDLKYAPLSSHLFPGLERILSPRIVHFTKRQLIWECAGGWKYEAARVEDKEYRRGQVRKFNGKAFVQPFLSHDGHQVQLPTSTGVKEVTTNHQGKVTGNDNEKERLATRLEFWHSCTDEFSRRSKGVEKKMEVAAILASRLDDGSMGEYLAGIWSKDISYGLAWAKQVENLTRPQKKDYRAPSWSWGSVDGKINTLLFTSQDDSLDDKVWNGEFLPVLISHDCVSRDVEEGGRYAAVKESASITLLGQTTSFLALSEKFKRENGGMDVMVQPILDQSHAFDCWCCAPSRPAPDLQQQERELQDVNHHVVLLLDRKTIGDVSGTVVVCLVLRRVEAREGVLERVGLAVASVSNSRGGEKGKEAVVGFKKRFEEVEWVRREVVLV